MKLKLQINNNRLAAKNEILALLKDYIHIKNDLYTLIQSIALSQGVPTDKLWDWAVKQIVPPTRRIRKPRSFTVKKNSLYPVVIAEEPKTEKAKINLPDVTTTPVKKPEHPKAPKAPKIKLGPPTPPKNIEKPKPSKLIDKTEDELNYIAACKAKSVKQTMAYLHQIKDPIYWRMVYKKTKSKALKIAINLASTDYEIANLGLQNPDDDIQFAVYKLVHRHVKIGKKLWADKD